MELCDEIIEMVRNSRGRNLPDTRVLESPKLKDLIAELYFNQDPHPLNAIFRPANLLSLLVPAIVNRLVVTLREFCYDIYVILLNKDGIAVETKLCTKGYDDDEFARYIDNSLIIPSLLDILMEDPYNQLFIDWHIIAEIRDYRHSKRTESRYTLLKSSAESNLQGARLLCNNRRIHKAEASVLLQTSGPLCLHPSPIVGIITNRLNFTNNMLMLPARKNRLKHRYNTLQHCIAPKKKKVKIETLNDIEEDNMMDFEFSNNYWDTMDSFMQPHVETLKPTQFDEHLKMDLYADRPNDTIVIQSFKISVCKVPEKEQYRIILCQLDSDMTSLEFTMPDKSRVYRFISKFAEVISEQDTILVRTIRYFLGKETINYNFTNKQEEVVKSKSTGSFDIKNILSEAPVKGRASKNSMQNGSEDRICSIFSDWSD